jgi:ribosomal protein L28
VYYWVPLSAKTPPKIMKAGIIMKNEKLRTILQNDPNELNKPDLITWTNKKISVVDVETDAKWIPNLSKRPNYVSKDREKTNIGIVGANIKFISKRGRLVFYLFIYSYVCT